MEPSVNAAFACSGLHKALGGKTVIDGLTMRVERGEVVSLLGSSGSGKTTLLRLIAGLLSPDAGNIEIDGRAVATERASMPPEKRKIGLVFQDYALWPHMTVAGNLTFGLKAQRLPAAEIAARSRHALEVTQLQALAERYPTELSGGQQQRVAIARCLAARPSLMLFDEPLSNLDAALREDLRSEMMTLVRREGVTALYVTHDQAEAMAVSDRIALLKDGRLAQFDTPQNIYDQPADAFVAGFIGGFSLLPGAVSSGRFIVPASAGLTLQTRDRADGPVFLVIRPEDARPADAFPDNKIEARVVSRAFQGRCWRLQAMVGESQIRLDWPDGPQEGSLLQFSLPPERCALVDRAPGATH